MEILIQKMLRLWDPYDLYCFPADEYDSYAKAIFEFTNNKSFTFKELSDFVFKLFKDGLKIKGSTDLYVEIEKLDRVSCDRFADLYFAIINLK